MEFELPVVYNGEELEYKARAVMSGYSYRFYVIVNDEELVFEKDDEQNYRVLSERGADMQVKPALLEAIIHSLRQITE